MHKEATDSNPNWWVNLLCVYTPGWTLKVDPDSWDYCQCINMAQEPLSLYPEVIFITAATDLLGGGFLNCVLKC